jgi:hypothetical protein
LAANKNHLTSWQRAFHFPPPAISYQKPDNLSKGVLFIFQTAAARAQRRIKGEEDGGHDRKKNIFLVVGPWIGSLYTLGRAQEAGLDQGEPPFVVSRLPFVHFFFGSWRKVMNAGRPKISLFTFFCCRLWCFPPLSSDYFFFLSNVLMFENPPGEKLPFRKRRLGMGMYERVFCLVD